MLAWLRRPEYPVLWAAASKFIGTPLLWITSYEYAITIIRSPSREVYAVAGVAFGVTAALAGICLSATAPHFRKTTPAVLAYSGEKFLHATLLLLQDLFLVFAREGLLGFAGVSSRAWLKATVTIVINGAASLITLTAALCWYWALDHLTLLRHEKRKPRSFRSLGRTRSEEVARPILA